MARFSTRAAGEAPATAQRRRGAPARATARCGLALLVAGLLSQAARAQQVQEPAWIPSIDLGFTTFDYSADATVENFIDPARFAGTRNDPARELLFQVGGEILAPPVAALPGRPRLFLQGRVQVVPFSADKILKFGELRGDTATEIIQFENALASQIGRGCKPRGTCPERTVDQFVGQGSDINAQIQNLSWYGALGVSFQVPVTDAWLVRVKPAAVYNFEKLDFSGRFRTVLETDPENELFEIRESYADASTTNHQLGVGLEVALGLSRSSRPVMVSIFANTQFLWLLSDPVVSFADRDGVAAYIVDRDSFGIHAGGGLRFSWMGLGAR